MQADVAFVDGWGQAANANSRMHMGLSPSIHHVIHRLTNFPPLFFFQGTELSISSSVTLTFNKGFGVSAEFLESAFFSGFLDLGMGSFLEVFQLGGRDAIFKHRVVD
ncbi:MAG: hypothetical protein ACJAVK_001669 [Akkermansiaceae bacterium]|jgi:hypothetical protein